MAPTHMHQDEEQDAEEEEEEEVIHVIVQNLSIQKMRKVKEPPNKRR